MRREQTRPPWRWLAALSAVSGLAVMLSLAARGQASMGAVLPACTMFVGGLVLFARLTTSPRKWERMVHGPTAFRFMTMGIAVSALIGVASAIILLDYLVSLGR
jgi:hypothetical protein